ncbi:MAG: toll/interleukin-1 receptor domain-containing protein [Blastocatellia bacterium]|nr:toll/interleukin-1 receptor domain-containing protein [Blastocatellia bacterium]
MGKTVFISYSHQQEEWVVQRLKPCLEAGGAEVLIDAERFRAGRAVVGQMDAAQDAAEITALVLTPDYLQSPYCAHEMKRAIARDPDFAAGATLPVLRESCEMPDEIRRAEPLWIDLRNDREAAKWDLLLDACEADLGSEAPHWLSVRDEVLQLLQRDQSVNLVVQGEPRWRELLRHIETDRLSPLVVVDLDKGSTAGRRGLVGEILKSCGVTRPVPQEPDDLIELDQALSARRMSHLALLRLDHANHRNYGVDLFSALRHLIMESRKLTLLAQSRRHFSELIPRDHPLSAIDLKTVELNGRNR